MECPEKRAGAIACPPSRSGIFRVRDRPMHLHVGFDVRNDFSCMAVADGVLMGCSTFGQMAGVLSNGIRFFSVGCDGWKTGPISKTIPPLVRSQAFIR